MHRERADEPRKRAPDAADLPAAGHQGRAAPDGERAPAVVGRGERPLGRIGAAGHRQAAEVQRVHGQAEAQGLQRGLLGAPDQVRAQLALPRRRVADEALLLRGEEGGDEPARPRLDQAEVDAEGAARAVLPRSGEGRGAQRVLLGVADRDADRQPLPRREPLDRAGLGGEPRVGHPVRLARDLDGAERPAARDGLLQGLGDHRLRRDPADEPVGTAPGHAKPREPRALGDGQRRLAAAARQRARAAARVQRPVDYAGAPSLTGPRRSPSVFGSGSATVR